MLPAEPMKKNLSLEREPDVIETLLGEHKGELGTRHHQLALASTTTCGIKLRSWTWIEHLLEVCKQEEHTLGPTLVDSSGRVRLMSVLA